MADLKISQLTPIGVPPASNDILPIVDVSASTTKSVTVSELQTALLTKGQASVNFGASTQTSYEATTTVSTASAVSASVITVTPAGTSTADHAPDEYFAEGIYGYVTNIIDGVSFDIVGIAPHGSHGSYLFNYIIA